MSGLNDEQMARFEALSQQAEMNDAEIAEFEQLDGLTRSAAEGATVEQLQQGDPTLPPSGSSAPVMSTEVTGFTADDISTEVDKSRTEQLAAEKTAQWNRLNAAFASPLFTSENEGAAVLSIAKRLGVPTDLVRANLPEFRKTAEAAEFNPDLWVERNPRLAKVLNRHHELAPTVLRSKTIGDLVTKFEQASSWLTEKLDLLSPADIAEQQQLTEKLGDSNLSSKEIDTAVGTAEQNIRVRRELDEAQRLAPKETLETDDPLARIIREKNGVDHLNAIAWQRTREGLYNNKRMLGFEELMRARFMEEHGLTPPRSSIDIEWELHDEQLKHPTRAFGDDAGAARLVGVGAQGIASTIGTVQAAAEAGGKSYVAAAGVTSAVALAVTGNPAEAAALGHEAGLLVAGKTAGAAAMLQMYRYETGASFERNLTVRTEEGKLLTNDEAMAGAVLEGLFKSALEGFSFSKTAALFKGSLSGAVRAAIARDPTFRRLVANVAKEYFESVATETITEGLQQGVEQAGEYLTKSAAEGRLQSGKVFKPGEIVSAMEGGAAASLALGIVPSAVTIATTPTVQRASKLALERTTDARAEKADKVVGPILDMAADPLVQARPDAYAEMIKDATAEHGAPLESLHVDAEAVRAYFQKSGESVEEQELIDSTGDETAPQRLKDALESGGKFEVPIQQVLGQWGASQLGKAMRDHTSTSPTALSPLQREQQKAALKQQSKLVEEEIGAELDREDELDQERQKIEQSVTEQRGAKEGKQIGALFAHFWRTSASEFKDVSPADIAQTFLTRFFEGDNLAMDQSGRTSESLVDPGMGEDGQPGPVVGEDAGAAVLEAAAAMSPEERGRALFIDKASGLRSERAWNMTPRTPGKQVLVLTTADMKAINDDPSGGHDTTNDLLRVIGREVVKFDPRAALAGPDFRLEVDPGKAEEVRAAVQAALPPGIVLDAGVGATAEEASKAAGAAVDAKRAAGEYGPRGSTKFDTKPLAEPGFRFSTEKDAHTGAVTDDLMAHVASGDTTPGTFEEQGAFIKEAMYDPKMPGVLSKTGFEAVGERDHVMALDGVGLRDLNQALGKEAGNVYLAIIASVARDLGGEGLFFAHLSGDEYAAKSDDKAVLESFARDLQEELRQVIVEARAADSKTYRIAPAVRFGIGEKTYGAADRALNAGKRSEAARGVTRGPAFGEVVGDSNQLPRRGDLAAVGRRADARRGEQTDAVGARAQGQDAEFDPEALSPGSTREPSRSTHSPEQMADARAHVSRMSTKNRLRFTRFLDFVEGWSTGAERPASLSRTEERKLAKDYGIVDPEFGFEAIKGIDTYGKSDKDTGRAPIEKSAAGKARQEDARKQFERNVLGRVNQSDRKVKTLNFASESGAARVSTYYGPADGFIEAEDASVVMSAFKGDVMWLDMIEARRGAGSDGMAELERRAKKLGIGAIGLQVVPVPDSEAGRVKVEEFYKKHGFERSNLAPWSEFQVMVKVLDKSAIDSETSFDPANPGQRLFQTDQSSLDTVKELAAKEGVKLDISERPDTIVLSRIVVPKEKRSSGVGTKVMKALVEHADRAGKAIALSPSTDFGASSVARLKKFYKQFGFIENKGRGRDLSVSESMIRRPDPSKQQLAVAKTETPGFKKWFEGSKVVDAEGNPKRVFHGSSHTNFDFFDESKQDPNALYGRGFYTTEDADIAASYLEKGKGESPGVFPLYLSIKNPIDATKSSKAYVDHLRKFKPKEPPALVKRMIDAAVREESENFSIEGMAMWAENTEWAYKLLDGKDAAEFFAPHFDYVVAKARDHMIKEIVAKRWGPADDILGFIKRNVFRSAEENADHADVREVLEMLGFDGITHIGGNLLGNGHEHRVWIAFESNQVKSAIGNSGAFDPGDKRILFQPGEDEKKPGASNPKVPKGYTLMPTTAAQGRRLFDVFLNAKSDASTAIHEAAHVFLEIMGELAARADAGERTRAKWLDTLKWMGTTEEKWATMKQDERTALHEKFAEAFEVYASEGSAPSLELEGMFVRFRDWVLQAFRTLVAQRAPINDDIRSVFDRMLATDDEIKRHMGQRGRPLFDNAKDAGMTDSQWADKLEADAEARHFANRKVWLRAKREQLREKEKLWKEELRAEEKAADKRFDTLPAAVAQAVLDGTLADTDAVVLDRKQVIDAVGRKLSRRFRTAMTGGRNIDEVGIATSFPNGKAMLEAVAALPSREEWVAAEADAAMKKKHGDLLTERTTLQKEVAGGLHDFIEKQQLEEWAQLQRGIKPGMGAPVIPAEVIREAAGNMMQRRAVKSLNGARVLAAERTAATAKAAHAVKGELDLATAAAKRQLLNSYLYRETMKALDEKEALEDLAKHLSKKATQAKLGKASPEYRNAASFILESVGLKSPSGAPNAIAAAVAMMNGAGFAIGDPEWVEGINGVLTGQSAYRTGDRMAALELGNLTVRGMRAVRDALKSLEAAANARNTILREGKRVDVERSEAEIIANLESTKSRKPTPATKGTETKSEALRGLLSGADGFLRNPIDKLRELVDDDQESETFKVLINPVRAGKYREAALLKSVVEPIIAAMERIPAAMKRTLNAPIDGASLFPSHTTDFSPPRYRHELLVMALNYGNESNAQRLRDGRKINDGEVRAALNLLTKEELAWVQQVFDSAEKLRPEAFALEERLSGLPVQPIKARPLVLANGTLAGGYFPVVYERAASVAGEKQNAASVLDPNYTRPSTPHGHLKKRVDKVAAVVSLAVGNVYRGLAQSAHDIAYREALLSAASMVLRPKIQKVLKERLGPDGAEYLMRWYTDIGGAQQGPRNVHERAVSWIRSNMAPALLGWRLSTALGDFANLLAAVPSTALKMHHLSTAVNAYMESPRKSRELALAKSEELQLMANNLRKQYDEHVREFTARGVFDRGPLAWLKDNSFFFMETVSKMTATPIWMGAYRQALAEGKPEAESVRWANDILTQVFPSHSPVEQSALLRDKGYVGLSTVFGGYLNTVYRANARIASPLFTTAFEHASLKDKAMTIGQVGATLLAFTVAWQLFGELYMGKGAEAGDDDDEDPENKLLRWRNWSARKLLTGPVQTLPLISEVSSTIDSILTGRQAHGRGGVVAEFILALGKGLADLKSEDKTAADKLEAIWRILGATKGMPQGMNKSLRYLLETSMGDRVVENPGRAVGGAIYGERDGQPDNVPQAVGDELSR